jgi:hypothetical protein
MGNQYTSQSRLNTELDSLVREVMKKQDRIIPIIGDDCFVGEIDGNYVPLQRWLAEEMLGDRATSEVKQKIYADGYKGLDLLFEEYKRINGDDYFDDYKDAVLQCIDAGISGDRLFLRQDIKDFLDAGKFDVIVTTCPYHILEQKITFGNKPYNPMSFAPKSNNLFMKSRAEATLDLPAIYQIFGDCEGEFVLNEEKLLEFLHHLNQTDSEKGFGASPLVKYIKDKGKDNKGLGLLMPIGCSNLPDWLFRFLWYPLSQYENSHKGGIWPNYRDEDFYKFLRRYQFRTFSGPVNALQNGNTNRDPVLDRLTSEFRNRRSTVQVNSTEFGVTWNDEGEWDIFISYASDDVEIAQRVYDVLTDLGKKVWMDRRGAINISDNYWSAIQYGIEHSSKILFLITNAYLRRAIVRDYIGENGLVELSGVYEEIDRIRRYFLNKEKDRQKGGYAIPLIIQGTTVTYTDDAGVIHKEVELDGGLLEKLPGRSEYQMLQTKELFEHIQGMKSSVNTIKADLEGYLELKMK